MSRRKPTPERIGAFSDGVIAIIITIMVLELKTPQGSSFAALFALWPTFASYALSYFFVGEVWVIHHHLLHHTERADPMLMWSNLIFLFFVSLIPFSTAYMAQYRMNSFTTALYSFVFLLVTLSYMFFQKAVSVQNKEDVELQTVDRAATRRNWVALALYGIAIPAAYWHPALSLGLILLNGALYFAPNKIETRPEASASMQ